MTSRKTVSWTERTMRTSNMLKSQLDLHALYVSLGSHHIYNCFYSMQVEMYNNINVINPSSAKEMHFMFIEIGSVVLYILAVYIILYTQYSSAAFDYCSHLNVCLKWGRCKQSSMDSFYPWIKCLLRWSLNQSLSWERLPSLSYMTQIQQIMFA